MCCRKELVRFMMMCPLMGRKLHQQERCRVVRMHCISSLLSLLDIKTVPKSLDSTDPMVVQLALVAPAYNPK